VHNRPPMRPRNTLTWILRGVGLLFALSGCGSQTDERLAHAQWSYIYPAIIQPSCATASCHSDITQRSGVDLYSKDVAYDQLVNRHYAVPNHPEASELIFLMKAKGARRMPPDFAVPEVDIDLISAWITAGAKQD
jgi:hypothetical protein